MMDYIKGKLTYVDVQYVVVEVHGVGYQIICGNPFQFQKDEGQDIQIFTYQYVREDLIALYGFSSREERGLFLKLLHVSGIGPKGALSILASGRPAEVITAIQTEDAAYLSKFPGVGKKTAQRIILDLKDKLDVEAAHFGFSAPIDIFSPSRSRAAVKSDSVQLQEALEALRALGYSDKEVDRITKELKLEAAEQNWDTDQYLKRGLQLLMR